MTFMVLSIPLQRMKVNVDNNLFDKISRDDALLRVVWRGKYRMVNPQA